VQRTRWLSIRYWLLGLSLGCGGWTASAGPGPDPAAALERALALAESNLRQAATRDAEKQYGAALLEGWLLMGALRADADHLPEARDAFRKASTIDPENRPAVRWLALAELRMGEPAEAVATLRGLSARDPSDQETRRALAQAQVASGQPEQALETLEQARASAPHDLMLAYELATGYLRSKRPDEAERLFAEIVKARPIAETHVLLGREYRAVDDHVRARAELQTALKLDPHVRWAHYYLGLLIVAEGGMAKLDEASVEFRAELRAAPGDVPTNVQLGMALVDGGRPAEALPALELATRAGQPEARSFYFLGRCLLALERPAEARSALLRGLELAKHENARDGQIGSIHNQLGMAARKLGLQDEAAGHFAEAERLLARGNESAREQMAHYLTDRPDAITALAIGPLAEAFPLAELQASERAELEARVKAALARAYLNLGVLQAQARQFARAADLFDEAAALDPDFPQVQYSLGVARFNAQELDKATAPLARALAATPGDARLKRMLAMAWLGTNAYEKAAELLQDDPERTRDPSVQYAYGLALAHSNRSAEAEKIFTGLLTEHADWAELHVMLGQAHAQEGDYAKAIQSLTQALKLKPDVAEANATLGIIYLKQGRLAEAEAALAAGLKSQPSDLQSAQNLAVVLDLEQRPGEAIPLLHRVLQAKPDFPDAHYLLGKILLAQEVVAEALEHLETAMRLAPEDANVRYQLGKAYQKQGRSDLAEQQFELFRQLKAKR
jgi:tetratricopeptide (TPR) repeat protein